MSRPSKPTEAELELLRSLWELGPSTVRHIKEHLDQKKSAQQKEVGYTTVLKLLQIMTDKGLVTRDESARSHIYSAAYPQESTQRQLVGDLLEKAFAGSATKLVLQALSAKPASAEELADIRALLDDLEDQS